MTLDIFAQYLVTGIAVGCIYALVAIGFNIVYNATGIINFAQGEFVMLGAMLAISCYEFLAPEGQPPVPGALLLAVVLGVALTMLIGAAVDFLFIRWLRQATVLRMIVITIGLSILLREAASCIWGNMPRQLPDFTGAENASVQVLGAYITLQKLWVIGLCAVTVAALTCFFRFTLQGQAMRACAANRNAAMLCGISARNVVTTSFMLSAGIGALGGCVLSPVAFTTYDMGAGLAIKGFTVAILGGLGNSLAAAGAGVLLGVLESFCTHAMPVAFKDAVTVGILLLILFVRPHGLFGSREAGRLKEF